MNLKPLEEIGAEIHEDKDQFFRFERGEGKVVIDGVEHTTRLRVCIRHSRRYIRGRRSISRRGDCCGFQIEVSDVWVQR